MRAFQRIRRIFGSHKRDRATVWRDGGVRRAKCRGCHKPMVQQFHGWILTRDKAA